MLLLDFGEARRWSREFPRKLDIQSVSHAVLQLLQPATPFRDLKDWDEHRSRISLDELCRGLPKQVLAMFRYSNETLPNEAEPDYDMLRWLMLKIAPSYSGPLIMD